MNILHIIVNFKTKLYTNLIHELSNSCTHQTIYYPHSKGKRVDYESADEKINYVQSQLLNLLTRMFYFFKIFKMYRNVKGLIDVSTYDIIHAHTLFSDGGLAYKIKQEYNIPYVVAIRNTDLNYFLKYKPWLKKHGRKILANAHQIICISPNIKDRIYKYYGSLVEGKLSIIGNGIEPGYFDNLKGKHVWMLNDTLKLLTVGNLNKNKNILELIKYSKLRKYELNVIGGVGNNYNNIMKLIEKSNCTNYLGEIMDVELLKRHFHSSTIFILPSIWETFGLVYIEAMSQGTPVIYSKGTGIDGFFKQGEVGYAVEPNNFDEWDFAIKNILENYDEISKRCIERAKDFNWVKIADDYSSIYKTILEEK